MERSIGDGLPCVIYMGTTEIERQQTTVFRMKLQWTASNTPRRRRAGTSLGERTGGKREGVPELDKL